VSHEKPTLLLRPAVVADAEFIARVRYSAINRIAVAAYPRALVEAWAGALDERRYQRFRDVIAGGPELMYVAENRSAIVGFGSVIPTRNELRAVYVDGSWVRCGVGAAILKQLESVALKVGCEYLELQSSLNAKDFYLAHGYIELAQATHGVGDAYDMACIIMRKQFACAT
jgi:GNAT superfamily N-acetyltransferase